MKKIYVLFFLPMFVFLFLAWVSVAVGNLLVMPFFIGKKNIWSRFITGLKSEWERLFDFSV